MAIGGTFLTYVSETVTIQRPMLSRYPRGINSPSEADPTFSIRVPPDELETITNGAKALGMSRSSFMRWCSYQVALDILKQKREYDMLSK